MIFLSTSHVSWRLLINTNAAAHITENEPNIFIEKYEEATHKEPTVPIAISDIVIYEVEEDERCNYRDRSISLCTFYQDGK